MSALPVGVGSTRSSTSVVDRGEDEVADVVLEDRALGRRRSASAASAHRRRARARCHGRDGHQPAATHGSRLRCVDPSPRAASERRHEQRDRGEEEQVRGPRGHQQPPEGVGLDRRTGEKPFTTRNAASQPAEQRRDRAASHAEDGEQPGERRPLGEACAPEELAELIHLRAPVLEVEVDVSAEVDVERDERCARRDVRLLHASSGGCRGRAPSRARARAGGDERGPNTTPSRQRRATRIRERSADAHEQVRRLHPARGPEQEPGQHGVGDPARVERAHDEERRREHERPSTGSRTARSARAPAGGSARSSAPGSDRRRAGSTRTAPRPRGTRPSSRAAARRSCAAIP